MKKSHGAARRRSMAFVTFISMGYMYNRDWLRRASPAAGRRRPGEERGEVPGSSAAPGGARGGLGPPLPLLAGHLVVVDHQGGVGRFAERFEGDDSKTFAGDFRAPVGPGFDLDGHPAEVFVFY